MAITLHGYWRSGTSYRVRIALHLKGLPFEQVTHDLRRGEQTAADYVALHPQGLVPALVADGRILTQSMAILEWLEETYPAPPLLPSTPGDRAAVRAMCNVIASDIHPLNNLRVLKVLRGELHLDETAVQAWMARWIASGFQALDGMIADYGDGFCFGDRPTLADCCLVPQVYAARRFGVPLSDFPNIVSAARRSEDHPAFAAAKPEHQPDADRA